MSSYRDLEIYKLSKELAIKVHKMTLSLPKFEMYEEGSQIRRSSKAIASAIVEGYGRSRYKAEYIKYLTYAHAECDETILHLEFLFETESLKDKEFFDEAYASYDQLGRKINKYTQWVEENWNEPRTSNPVTRTS
ncbi:MAG: four helix bundle protein [Cyclobacteriaceae bacterium]|nr:four helix bundle protein [Cyclobacteriaceae bacterium]